MDETLSFREIERRARHLAVQLLADGVGKGTRVAFILPQGPEWVVCLLAVTRVSVRWRCPSVRSPHRRRYANSYASATPRIWWFRPPLPGRTCWSSPSRLAGLAETATPHLLLPDVPFLRRIVVLGGADRAWATVHDGHVPGRPGDDELLAAVESEVVPADHMVTLFTSGTTSGPKGVQHTHGAQLRHVANIVSLREWKQGAEILRRDALLLGGRADLPAAADAVLRRCVACQERFDPPTALDLIERFKPDLYLGWPNATAKIRNDPSFGARK